MTDNATPHRDLRLVTEDGLQHPMVQRATPPSFGQSSQEPGLGQVEEAVDPYVGAPSAGWAVYLRPLLLETGIAGLSGTIIGGAVSTKKDRWKNAGLGAMLGVGLQSVARAGFGGMPQSLRALLGVLGLLLAGGGLYLALKPPTAKGPGLGRARAARAKKVPAAKRKPMKRRAPVERRAAQSTFSFDDEGEDE